MQGVDRPWLHSGALLLSDGPELWSALQPYGVIRDSAGGEYFLVSPNTLHLLFSSLRKAYLSAKVVLGGQ